MPSPYVNAFALFLNPFSLLLSLLETALEVVSIVDNQLTLAVGSFFKKTALIFYAKFLYDSLSVPVAI